MNPSDEPSVFAQLRSLPAWRRAVAIAGLGIGFVGGVMLKSLDGWLEMGIGAVLLIAGIAMALSVIGKVVYRAGK